MRVHRVRGVMASAYLIESDGLFLVDAGFVGTAGTILRAIRRIGWRPEDLRLALVTHPHLDHYGGLPALRDVTRCRVAAHPDATVAVAEGHKEYSPGLNPWTRFVEWLSATSLPHLTFRGTGAAYGLDDGEGLHRLGLPGRVFHTPGHTETCISLLLDDGTALTGDLVQGALFPGAKPTPPAMAVSHGRAYASWKRLLDAGATRVLPAHGEGFSRPALAAALERAGAA